MQPKVAVVCFWYGQWPESDPRLGESYVRKLQNMVLRNTVVPVEFIVFVDGQKYNDKKLLSDMFVLPISRQYESFRWNLKKLFMFSQEAGLRIFDWVVCMDLDLVINRPIDNLLNYRSNALVTCKGAYTDNIGGSVVGFDPKCLWTVDLTNYLVANLTHIERDTKGSERMFYRRCQVNGIIPKVEYWQDLFPGVIDSFKVNGYREEVPVVRFHGKPRPHELSHAENPWIFKVWR